MVIFNSYVKLPEGNSPTKISFFLDLHQQKWGRQNEAPDLFVSSNGGQIEFNMEYQPQKKVNQQK